MNLFTQLEKIIELIPLDFGGGSPLSKTYLMAYLILKNNLKTFVEIGVYRGMSLFPVTYAIKQNNGMSYGVDPYNIDDAKEFDVDEDLKKQIDEFFDELDFENIYQNVIKLKSEFGFEKHLELIRKKSSESVEFFRKNNITIDMLHIDGNHDTKYVMEDVELFLPLLKPKSIVVMDDIDWNSVKPAYEKLKEKTTVIFESSNFAILINGKIPEEIVNEYEFELYNTFNLIEDLNEKLLQKNSLIEVTNAEKVNAITHLETIIGNLETAIGNLETVIGNLETVIGEKVDAITNLDRIIKEKINETTNLETHLNSVQDELLNRDKEILNLESNIDILANSRKSDLYKNFQIISGYIPTKQFPIQSISTHLSHIPSMYIFLKSKGNIKKAWRNIRGYRSIISSQLFDKHYYFTKNRNILISGMNPLIHYMYYGYKENRSPSAIFDDKYYLNRYNDVKNSRINPLIHYSLYGANEGKKINDIKISVIVTSYNHEKYIRECIDNILVQKGVFFELIIGDDYSGDGTREILEEYESLYPEIIKLLPSSENVGVTMNLKRCLEAVTGDYIAICEGDDYWTDPYKLQKQVNFLEKRKDCVICFNSILMFYENDEKKNYIFQKNLRKDTFRTRDLILDNFIGNFSCCMYRTNVVKKLPDNLYDIFSVDWMFNIACSEYGNIGFLNENMTVYRIHDGGLWSSKGSFDKSSYLLPLIDIYNEFLSFRYDSDFSELKKNILSVLKNSSPAKRTDFYDIIILDDLFPHPLSPFRLQEYNSYLEHFNNIRVYCNALSFPLINERRSLETIINNYEKEYPQFKSKVERFLPKMSLQAKLIYTIFLANIYLYIGFIEKYKIPFAFTLYPGGGFELKNKSSDKKLKRVFSSPFFRKVIVTQKIVYDYLLDNKFCKPEQIEMIFGVVTPLKLLENEYNNKKYFGSDKPHLDICFVAHKYSEKGLDKGYDIFIEVACELSKKYENIYFHVVGNFDENVLDINSIKDRISFYGLQSSEWFHEFYKDKDIILSPNIPFKLSDGAFDGFPTGCCTEAGLHNVAILCTDELKLNMEKYKDKKEIVIIPHDTQKIVEIIEYYYHNPKQLQKISKSGYLKIKDLYNYENQIAPRIKILEELIGN